MKRTTLTIIIALTTTAACDYTEENPAFCVEERAEKAYNNKPITTPACIKKFNIDAGAADVK